MPLPGLSPGESFEQLGVLRDLAFQLGLGPEAGHERPRGTLDVFAYSTRSAAHPPSRLARTTLASPSPPTATKCALSSATPGRSSTSTRWRSSKRKSGRCCDRA